MRIELWGPSPGGLTDSFLTAGRDVDALRFHVEDCPARETWCDGAPELLPDCPAGSCSMLDYWPRRQWRGETAPMIVFRIQRDALAAWALTNGHKRFEGLRYTSGEAFTDPVLTNLALAIHRSLIDSRAAAPAFTKMILESVLACLVGKFGSAPSEKHRGGLTAWQLREVKRFVANKIHDRIQLADLADICGLSVSYFVKAFTVATGTTPRQWLISRRVERARALLQAPKFTLAEIASSCGFSDQAHFTRTFTKLAGISPGAWRKQTVTGVSSI